MKCYRVFKKVSEGIVLLQRPADIQDCRCSSFSFCLSTFLNGKSFAVKELQAMMMKERDEDVFKAIVNMMLCDVEDMKLTAGGFSFLKVGKIFL